MKLYVAIYNWRISFPNEDILLAIADIKTCFCFPQIHADFAGAFGFQAQGMFLLATSMVFGSNTPASSWEPFRRAIKTMAVVFFEKEGLVEKHSKYLNLIEWREDQPSPSEAEQVLLGEVPKEGLEGRPQESLPDPAGDEAGARRRRSPWPWRALLEDLLGTGHGRKRQEAPA